MASDIEVQEYDSTGYPSMIYRVDRMTGQAQSTVPQRANQTSSTLFIRLSSPFLPAGYPATVTADYTPYQIYDSLQAFASTIAGLLASRAVFVGMGVGSEDASLITTMLLYIAQETIGRLATIFFADRFSQRIEANVKFYRFFADIVNDTAFILDCISPIMPTVGRAMTLGVSNACRALCGVAGGSSKAILSSHFAKSGNVGELNAKDGSQETVVSLVGMWVGGLVVSKVHGTFATWACLLPLLAFHLWCNWQAVKSVRLTNLNLERASILFEGIGNYVKSPIEVGKQEGIMRNFGSLRSENAQRLQCLNVGARFQDLLGCIHHTGKPDTGRSDRGNDFLPRLLHIFRQEAYLVWVAPGAMRSVIMLRDGASNETQAKALFHLMLILQRHEMQSKRGGVDGGDQKVVDLNQADDTSLLLGHVEGTLQEVNAAWIEMKERIEKAGWDLRRTNLESGARYRFRTKEEDIEDKKKR